MVVGPRPALFKVAGHSVSGKVELNNEVGPLPAHWT